MKSKSHRGFDELHLWRNFSLLYYLRLAQGIHSMTESFYGSLGVTEIVLQTIEREKEREDSSQC